MLTKGAHPALIVNKLGRGVFLWFLLNLIIGEIEVR